MDAFRKGRLIMARTRHTPEQIINKLRAIEVHISSGLTQEQAVRKEEVSVQTYCRWRKEYGGLKVDQAKRLKEMEKENARLKRLVAELSLDKQMLQEVAEGNF